MTYKFTNAFIRKPNKSIRNALSSQHLNPSYEKILEMHNNYINCVEEAGLKIILLDDLKDYPDSIFVEDPALIYKNNLIVLNPFLHNCEITGYFSAFAFVLTIVESLKQYINVLTNSLFLFSHSSVNKLFFIQSI